MNQQQAAAEAAQLRCRELESSVAGLKTALRAAEEEVATLQVGWAGLAGQGVGKRLRAGALCRMAAILLYRMHGMHHAACLAMRHPCPSRPHPA